MGEEHPAYQSVSRSLERKTVSDQRALVRYERRALDAREELGVTQLAFPELVGVSGPAGSSRSLSSADMRRGRRCPRDGREAWNRRRDRRELVAKAGRGVS
jgi:hypothetical protein